MDFNVTERVLSEAHRGKKKREKILGFHCTNKCQNETGLASLQLPATQSQSERDSHRSKKYCTARVWVKYGV